HMRSSLRWIPDSADSIGYGTSTRSPSDRPTGGVDRSSVPANSQTPLRLCQRSRVSCGRGYSGWALSGPTWPVHGVDSGGVPGCHTGSAVADVDIAGIRATVVTVAVSAPSTLLRTVVLVAVCMAGST